MHIYLVISAFMRKVILLVSTKDKRYNLLMEDFCKFFFFFIKALILETVIPSTSTISGIANEMYSTIYKRALDNI